MRINTKKIEITLSLKADGPVPEPVRDTLGEVITGPMGLLHILESQLGIPSKETPFTTRLIQYLGCIEQVHHPDAFYYDSYKADPFSVARNLLQWRDQWYEAGWEGSFEQGVPAKLADMAVIEELAIMAVQPNIGQRIQRIIELLSDNPIAIESITLRDPQLDFPHLWQKLFVAIGVKLIEEEETPPQAKEDTDLGKLQRHLLSASKNKIELNGDGSVMVLRADSAHDTTQLTALLSQQQLASSPEQTLAILAERRGDLLDDAMEVIGAPRLGFSALSTWRPILQVLPLACELIWDPLNPTALFQFLSHSVGPIPARQREVLAKTAAEVPGIGSKAWEAAISRCLEPEEEENRQHFEDNIRYWLESPRHDQHNGIESYILAERAQHVVTWLSGAREASKDPALQTLYSIALNQTTEFVKAIERLREHGLDTLSRDHVLRLIEDVRGSGAPITDRQTEVDPSQARAYPATHAGTFHTPIDRVMWWDCQTTDSVHRWPWSREERATLEANSVILQSEDKQLEWLGKAWMRPLLCAKQQCTLVLHDDTDRHHPVWDLIQNVTENLPIFSATDSAAITALGIPQTKLETRQLPPKVRWWMLPGEVNLPKRRFESYSSLDAYIYSPYQWLLRYAAKISPGSLDSISDGSLLKGSLAHRLFEEFFNSHSDIQSLRPQLIPNWVDEYVPILLQQEGALLLEPGRQAECERLISVLQEALTTLVEHLQKANVEKVAMEVQQEGQFIGGKLIGSIDLLATASDGREAVVDIKWGGRNFRRNALQEGSYLQLATYAQLRLAANTKTFPLLSYFIVSDAHMLNLAHHFFPSAEPIFPDTEENPAQYWKRFQHTWQWRKEQFDAGLIEVTVEGTEPTESSIPGDDGLSMPETSDTFNDYSVLTGWEDNA